MELKGKTALVTGAAKRIGREIALSLADRGVNVVVHYRGSAEEAEDVARRCRDLGVNSVTVKADLEDRDELDNLIERATDAAGNIDILVNNASVFPEGRLETIDYDDLAHNISVNAWAPFVLSRKLSEHTEEAHIVNILDNSVNKYDWQHFAYHASKYLFALFTKECALAFAPGIKVNGVAPGLILPPEGEGQDYIDKLKGRVPMKKAGRAGDVAEAVIYLASSEYITGQVINIDGGRHLGESLDG